MKTDAKWFAALLVLTLILCGAYLAQLTCPTEGTQVTIRTHDQRAVDAPRNATIATGSPLARELNTAGGTAQRDVQVLHGMIGQILLVVKEPNRPPLGINEDFAKALTGGNKAHLAVIPPGHPAIVDGKIVDRWGTPYFFHPRAADAIDIRSAGPDRKLFTDDDVFPTVGKPNPDATGEASHRH